jgi:septum site-determining protein MinC
MALVLVPEPPAADWLSALDAQIARSPGFFAGRPAVVDFAALPPDDPLIPSLIDELRLRGVQVIGVEGLNTFWAGSEVFAHLPVMTGARPAGQAELPEEKPAAEPTGLLVETPVRSGQSVVFPRGDVTIVGSVASGAEVIAGGSVHVYGTLRGRAVAGLMGNPQARIFCRRLEAELLAIDGLYRTADDMEPALRGRAVQAWLQGDAMIIAALD